MGDTAQSSAGGRGDSDPIPLRASGDQPQSRRSPADAFDELKQVLRDSCGDVSEIGAFVRACRDKLLRGADEFRYEGMRAVLESLLRLHDRLYRQVTAMESGEHQPDTFVISLFETLETELRVNGVEVIRPHSGDEVDLAVMTTIGVAPCPFWRKPGRIAKVESCGFMLNMDSTSALLRKAEVTVLRR